MSRTNAVVRFSVAFCLFIAFLFGLHGYLSDFEENRCQMTYMYEYPQYIKIDLTPELKASFPNYNLFVYGEGELAEKYHRGHFNGIPVLFIPGNAGSHKQVRSLASVAYRKALDSKKRFHFDFFALDFNEDLSAIFGGVLNQQTSFTAKCITTILQLYQSNKEKPSSIVLIGHSMGGIIAKAVFAEEEFDSSTVETIITLATPHRKPVVALDRHLITFYRRVNKVWSASSNKTHHVVLASIGGGSRDIQVRSGLTISSQESTINVLTTEMPGVWLSADHLCMVWCKQVVSSIVRSLFDMVNPSTNQLTHDEDQRKEILFYHYVKRFAGKTSSRSKHPPVVTFDPDGRWREVIAKRMAINFTDETERINTYLMIPLVDNPHRDRLMAMVSSLGIRHWIFGCMASAWHKNTRFCEKGVDLSDQTLLLPATGDGVKRKLIYLDLVHLKRDGFTHVVVNVPKNQDKAVVQFDVHCSVDRNVDFGSNPWTMSYVNLSIPADILVYNITLPDLSRPWQSLKLTVHGADCPAGRNSLIRKVVPWSHEAEFFLTNQSITVQLHSPKSPMDSEYDSTSLQLLNFHQCQYDIKISTNWKGIASQLLRFYGPGLFPLVVAIFVDCFAQQLAARGRKNPVPSTLRCLFQISIIKTALIPEAVTTILDFMESWHLPWWPLPRTDDYIMRFDGLGLPLIYLILGTVAWTIALLLSCVFWLSVLAGGTAMHSLLIRYLRARLGISALIAELVTLSLTRLPLVVSVILVAIAISTCGSVALLLGCIFCIWKMFAYYEDQLESAVTGAEVDEKQEAEKDDSFHLNSTISLMWICTTLLSLPSLIVWMKNPSSALPNDPSFIVSIAWSVFGMIVWQKSNALETRRFGYLHLSIAVSILSILLSVYGLFAIYRVKYFLTCVIVLYAIQQLA